MIRARELHKRFAHHEVLRGTTFEVGRGERVALLGLNGAGKTTLMRCLLGLTPCAGDLTIAGHHVRSDGRAARSRLGYVPQRAPHFDGSLLDVVEFFAALRSTPTSAIRTQLEELGLSLDQHGSKSVNTLSGGMLQKVLLALALASHVDVLLLDEPTANLDPRARREFLRAIKQVDPSTTIFLASHRLADVEAVADRLLVLHDGVIAFDGPIRELRRQNGATSTLWIKVASHRRDAVHEHLVRSVGRALTVANGSAVGVTVEHRARAHLLGQLTAAGFEIEDFWTETASLNDLIENVLTNPTARPS